MRGLTPFQDACEYTNGLPKTFSVPSSAIPEGVEPTPANITAYAIAKAATTSTDDANQTINKGCRDDLEPVEPPKYTNESVTSAGMPVETEEGWDVTIYALHVTVIYYE